MNSRCSESKIKTLTLRFVLGAMKGIVDGSIQGRAQLHLRWSLPILVSSPVIPMRRVRRGVPASSSSFIMIIGLGYPCPPN